MIYCKETLAVLSSIFASEGYLVLLLSLQKKGLISCINCTEINLEIINNVIKFPHLFKEYILYINLI